MHETSAICDVRQELVLIVSPRGIDCVYTWLMTFVHFCPCSWMYVYYGNMGFKEGDVNLKDFWLKIDTLKGNCWTLRIGVVGSCIKNWAWF